jgi:hypothetical protein
VVFGLCGHTSLSYYEAFYDPQLNIKHLLTRDERLAGYIADAYARLSGRVGLCEGPSGGGATYILPGDLKGALQGALWQTARYGWMSSFNRCRKPRRRFPSGWSRRV